MLFMLLLLFSSSKAPGLSNVEHSALYDRLYGEYTRIKYEVEFNNFINMLGYKESRNNWMIVNSIGCLGEWQFSRSTLKQLGYGHITAKTFKNSPSIFPRQLQLEVLKNLIRYNSNKLKEYECFIGTVINGTIITKAGLLAGAHLGGVGSVKVYLNSIGRVDRQDKYGTKISDYIREFSMFNL